MKTGKANHYGSAALAAFAVWSCMLCCALRVSGDEDIQVSWEKGNKTTLEDNIMYDILEQFQPYMW